MEEKIREAENVFLHVYNRYEIILEKGDGVYLYDTKNRKYLDFGAGIAVAALGYGNTELNEAIKEQVDKLLHTSNLFYNLPAIEAAKKLAAAARMDRVFFTNSGAEAIEGAIKAAKKYAYNKNRAKPHEIIAMHQSFHGRSLGALSVTGNSKYQEPFQPMMAGVKFARFNEISSVRSMVSERTCAIILEPVQGEGGIYPAKKEFLEDVKDLCEREDILLIFDEIQCGMGRTGDMFAWQGYGVKPDIMACAKALGCGVPVGAFLTTEKVAESSLAPGDHGTTYGGNPLACAAASAVLDIYGKLNLTDHVKTVGDYLEQRLDALVAKHDSLIARRGMGLMQGLVTRDGAADIIKKAQKNGLIVLSSGSAVLRLVPPLVIGKQHVDEMIEKLEPCL